MAVENQKRENLGELLILRNYRQHYATPIEGEVTAERPQIPLIRSLQTLAKHLTDKASGSVPGVFQKFCLCPHGLSVFLPTFWHPDTGIAVDVTLLRHEALANSGDFSRAYTNEAVDVLAAVCQKLQSGGAKVDVSFGVRQECALSVCLPCEPEGTGRAVRFLITLGHVGSVLKTIGVKAAFKLQGNCSCKVELLHLFQQFLLYLQAKGMVHSCAESLEADSRWPTPCDLAHFVLHPYSDAVRADRLKGSQLSGVFVEEGHAERTFVFHHWSAWTRSVIEKLNTGATKKRVMDVFHDQCASLGSMSFKDCPAGPDFLMNLDARAAASWTRATQKFAERFCCGKVPLREFCAGNQQHQQDHKLIGSKAKRT